MLDLILRNARLLDGALTDIGIEDGVIVRLGPHLETSAKQEVNIAGNLTLPAFVNGQLHACKVFWRRKLEALPEAVQRLPRFEAAKHVKRTYTPEDVFERVDEVMRLALKHGTCAIRLFADVDKDSGLNAVKGLLKIKEVYEPLMSVQVVAFPQDGVGGRTEQLMREALDLGADVVGGIPWIEAGEDAQKAHTDMCFSLAKEFHRDVHMVCDDVADAGSRTLEYLARQTVQHSYQNRVAATQCAALAFYDDAYAREVIGLVKNAGVTVFSNAHVSLVTTERRGEPYPRGITRVRDLLAAGVNVACAQDDIDNWYYPFGRNDLLEVAQFMTHVGGFGWESEKVVPMVTEVPAKVMGLQSYGLAVGKSANIVVLGAQTWREALQFQAAKQHLVLRGQCWSA